MDENVEQERQAASDRLAEAWRRGHLDAGEHERRTTALRHATSLHEVEAAERGGIEAGQNASSAVSPVPPLEGRASVSPIASETDNRTSGLVKVDKTTAGTISALVPLLCVLAFFAFDVSWVVFLLIPIVGILLYGPDGKKDD